VAIAPVADTSQSRKLHRPVPHLTGQNETSDASVQPSLHARKRGAQTLTRYIAALLAKKREMEQALRDYVAARASHAAGPGSTAGASTRGKSEDRVANAGAVFDRVLAKQTGLSGLTSAATGDAAKLRELQDLQRANRIQERLAQLKLARQPGGGPG
jgi:phage shock protein A